MSANFENEENQLTAELENYRIKITSVLGQRLKELSESNRQIIMRDLASFIASVEIKDSELGDQGDNPSTVSERLHIFEAQMVQKYPHAARFTSYRTSSGQDISRSEGWIANGSFYSIIDVLRSQFTHDVPSSGPAMFENWKGREYHSNEIGPPSQRITGLLHSDNQY